jgi:hypothetical protein
VENRPEPNSWLLKRTEEKFHVKRNRMILVLAGYGILGCIFLGLVISLGNFPTNQYIDYSLPEAPLVQEYDFRAGGEYGFISLFLLVSGSVLAISGNLMCIHLLYQSSATKHRIFERERKSKEKTSSINFVICPQCWNRLPENSKFCPRCGRTLTPDSSRIPQKAVGIETAQTLEYT